MSSYHYFIKLNNVTDIDILDLSYNNFCHYFLQPIIANNLRLHTVSND